MSDRSDPPPELKAAAERSYEHINGELIVLLSEVRKLLGAKNELVVITHVWATLLVRNPRAALLVGAVAIVHLAQASHPGGAAAPNPRRTPT
jgi:hypothetical protein